MSKQALLESKLREGLSPTHLEVTNESHKHNVPPGSETHFKIVAVSPLFEGKVLLARHREIYRVLDDEIKQKKVHALAVHTFTPDEWEREKQAQTSPPCLGGSKADRKG